MTEQEAFWKGKFGDDYIERNISDKCLSAKIAAFAEYMKRADYIDSSLELGANIGLNERALQLLYPEIQMEAVEINHKACEICSRIKNVKVTEGSILDYKTDRMFDLTFTHGVLIHQSPDTVNDIYDILYKYSKKYILMSEYYNPVPIEVEYRGNQGKLFKRDWAGEMMDKYHDLVLRDYGFIYHRGTGALTGDDLTWFLLEKIDRT